MPPDETQTHREISVDLLEFPVWSVSKIAGSGDIYNFWKWGWHWQPEKLFGINEYPCDFSSSSPSCGSFEPSVSSAMNECLHELMNDWMNEGINEWINDKKWEHMWIIRCTSICTHFSSGISNLKPCCLAFPLACFSWQQPTFHESQPPPLVTRLLALRLKSAWIRFLCHQSLTMI